MNSILRIYVLSTLNTVSQHTKVLTVVLDLAIDISKQPILYNQVQYSLKIKSIILVRFIIHLTVVGRIINLIVVQFNMF